MPSFNSCFHLPYHGGGERVVQEKAAAKERKRLRRERVMKHMERQRRIASLSDDGDDDEEEGSEEEDEDPVALWSALDVSRRSGDGAGPSGTDHSASVATEEGSARKRAASSLLRGLSPKHPCTTVDGG